jgi:geranylgeranyl reductase family protein
MHDVAVVGAGPSGAWTAALLAQRGARVLLLDSSHPREKPCGGGVTGRALALVGNCVALKGLPAVAVRRARFVDSRAGTDASVTLASDNAALIVVSRAEFDGRLLAAAQAAGADVVAARVTELVRADTGFRLTTANRGEFRVPLVVGADGANSLVRRRVSRAFPRGQLSVATGYFARGVTSEEIVIEMTVDPPGYIWSFPRPDHLAIGICAQADTGVTVDTLRTTVRNWIVATGIAGRAPLDCYSWPIPSLDASTFLSLEMAGPGWFTVGDAAGLVDPITREGIYFGLRSAELVAETIASTVANRARVFTDRIRHEIGADLARAARFKAGFFRPRFARLLVDALAASPQVREVMADLVAGTQSYRGLKWRLAKTLELGLAWRWATDRS